MRVRFTIIVFATNCFCLLTGAAFAAGPDANASFDFFETRIRPVLISHCYECHSHESGESQGGLRLDSRAAMLQGGDSGSSILAEDVDSSLLMEAIQYKGLEMPPNGKLPDDVIEDFRTWMHQGAADPRVEPVEVDERSTQTATTAMTLADAANFWSFMPLTKPVPPSVDDAEWPRGAIDQFVLARWEADGQSPVADAAKQILLRRIYIDLIGLPPTIQQQQKFLSSTDPNAYRQLVDELLQSKHFGERWGRHWLDLARFADSTGGGSSELMPDAWKYRDYVIDSFNMDKPYDDFIRQQIAGDLLPWSSLSQRADNLVATGFLVLGPRSYITDDPAIFHLDGIDEQITVLGQALLGMTLECARCHDHKFDPIPTSDYYALGGILASTISAKPQPGTKNFVWNTCADPLDDPDGSRLAEYERVDAQIAVLTKKTAKRKRDLAYVIETNALPPNAGSEMSVVGWIELNQTLLSNDEASLAALKASLSPKPATMMAVRCDPNPSDMRLQIRGNPHRPGDYVKRGFVQAVSLSMQSLDRNQSIPDDQSGRLELANWLASPQNPLTARVIANRVWQHLFGRGLVTTVNNFGTTGQPPSHPQLLDWMASTLIQDGWSIKSLIRHVVLSRTYQQSILASNDDESSVSLVGRRTPRSLDAETIRDSILLASGELNLQGGGPSFPDSLEREVDYEFDSARRSVYLPRFRNHQYDLFQTFDAANPAMTVGQRDATILPNQALFLMNNDFILEQSLQAAEMALGENCSSDRERVEQMYLRTLSRLPAATERQLASAFVQPPSNSETDSSSERLQRWAALQQTLWECVNFRFVE